MLMGAYGGFDTEKGCHEKSWKQITIDYLDSISTEGCDTVPIKEYLQSTDCSDRILKNQAQLMNKIVNSPKFDDHYCQEKFITAAYTDVGDLRDINECNITEHHKVRDFVQAFNEVNGKYTLSRADNNKKLSVGFIAGSTPKAYHWMKMSLLNAANIWRPRSETEYTETKVKEFKKSDCTGYDVGTIYNTTDKHLLGSSNWYGVLEYNTQKLSTVTGGDRSACTTVDKKYIIRWVCLDTGPGIPPSRVEVLGIEDLYRYTDNYIIVKHIPGPLFMYVGKVGLKNRWKSIKMAFICLWKAILGYQIAGLRK